MSNAEKNNEQKVEEALYAFFSSNHPVLIAWRTLKAELKSLRDELCQKKSM